MEIIETNPSSDKTYSDPTMISDISVGIDPGQTRPSIRFVSGRVKSLLLTDGSVEWDFGRARTCQV